MDVRLQLFSICQCIMFKAYEGQFQHDGITPYITHPIELSIMFDRYLDKCIAMLHDALEDGKDNGVDYDYISDQLNAVEGAELDIPYILIGIKTLTHDPEEDTYMEYIDKVCDGVFRKFKIADITCNLADSPTEYQKKKYKKAMKRLLTGL